MAVSEISRCTYHVFLSFRGEDTRKSFTGHLYTALVHLGIQTFRDDEEIERGNNIKDEIEKAILHDSKISIVVFSKNYAASTWCLNELVMILEHKKSSKHIVLPVFYDVDPSQVKNQTGSYAEAFTQHEQNFKSETNMVQRWRNALKEVAAIGGMVLQDRHESQFIQDIVKEVQNKLHLISLYVPPYLVGIDSLVTQINQWLEQDGANKVGIATICGIGGIGKTTIAKVVYNQNIPRFEGYSFLADVRETSQDCNGLVRLQSQLLSDILKGKSHKIYNIDNGINKIKEVVCCRRVLLVLDDVDELEKIRKLMGTQIPFHLGSKIIITSRNRCLLNAHFISQMFDSEASTSCGGLSKLFEVKELASSESLQLFNWYAFGHNSVPESSMAYAKSLVKHCGGLPLALQVLGSSLSSKSVSSWKSALEKLEEIPDSKIQKILRISYDSLEDNHDKNLFLDIVCLFIGKDRDYTTTILDGCDFYTTIGIENLVGMSLLIINEKNKLMMHQMIRDMGREIIRQESCDIGKRSRLWHKNAFDVVREKIGSRTVKCLTLDLKGLLEDKAKRTNTTLHFPKNSKSQFLMANDVDMETQAFAKMKRLKLLQLDYVRLKGDFKDFPKRLRWLRWHGFCMQSFPVDFDINELVVLDMRNSKLKQVWKDTECLPNLKILNLNHSHSLLKTPSFSGLPSLEKLMLKDCINLVEVDQSIGELKMLTFLNLKDCTSLRKLPRTIGSLISLEELILSGCSRLDDVPRELHNMESLKVLNLDETAIYQSRLGLQWLLLKRSKGLGFSWASLPGSLVKLSLESCKLSNDVMPNDLCNLASLKSLNLSRNPIRYLPESLKYLTELDQLLLTSCTELQMIPKLPVLLDVFECNFIFGVNSSLLPRFFSSTRCVNIFGCEKLTEVEDLFKVEPIENFGAEEIRRLFNVDSINRNRLQLYSYLTDSIMLATPQVLQECGITSTFVVGSEVPIGFKHRTNEHRISFFLPTPSHPDEKIHRFSLCIVFSLASDQMLELLPGVHIFNETKRIMQRYRSSFIGIPQTNDNTMLWLIHWPVTDCQFEGGDLVSCMVVPMHLSIRKFGVTCESEHNIGYEYDFSHLSTGDEVSTRNIKIDLTKFLLSLESYGNVKVQLCSYIEESKVVLYDYGIITTFDPLPFDYHGHYFGHQAGKTEVSISVPPNSSRKISCFLNSIIIFSAKNDKTYGFLPCLEIVNETKGTKWTYSKHFMGIPETKNTLYWTTCWNFRGDELEAGDHVSLRVLSDLSVLEIGIDLVYDYELDDNPNFFSQLPRMSKCFKYLLGIFVYISSKSEKDLYRLQSLVKC
ncbi:disease resistance protein RPV1 isoform X3 [Gossypium hirsutum]|uniref:Disease resistance protein RPV1 isoform X3 n=1 Tax=Gossypium hirsutum TaxID=3635 RepID=A0ABM2ZV52_GOSHI|nr:disease resistance protein RPV1-like isoform X3 [Gossypium hirsutum]